METQSSSSKQVTAWHFKSAGELQKLFNLPTIENWRESNLLAVQEEDGMFVLYTENELVKTNLPKIIKWNEIDALKASVSTNYLLH